jgi:hypothetical protein
MVHALPAAVAGVRHDRARLHARDTALMDRLGNSTGVRSWAFALPSNRIIVAVLDAITVGEVQAGYRAGMPSDALATMIGAP